MAGWISRGPPFAGRLGAAVVEQCVLHRFAPFSSWRLPLVDERAASADGHLGRVCPSGAWSFVISQSRPLGPAATEEEQAMTSHIHSHGARGAVHGHECEAAARVGHGADLDGLLHGRAGLVGPDHGASEHAARPARRACRRCSGRSTPTGSPSPPESSPPRRSAIASAAAGSSRAASCCSRSPRPPARSLRMRAG